MSDWNSGFRGFRQSSFSGADKAEVNLPSVASISCMRCKEAHPINSIEFMCFTDGNCQKCRAELSGKFAGGKSLMVGKMRLIGIAGKARSGKDTAAKYLLNKLGSEWYIASFADPMKEMLNVIGIDTGDSFKDLPINQFGVSTRHMLQTLGTEWGRNLISNDFWVDVFANMNAYQCVIVPDVRFENEADLIREHGVLICIEGRGGVDGSHISERKLQYDDRDIYIDNRGSLSELYEKLDLIDFDSE